MNGNSDEDDVDEFDDEIEVLEIFLDFPVFISISKCKNSFSNYINYIT